MLKEPGGGLKASDIIALVALCVSIATAVGTLWRSWVKARKADVGATFYWLPDFAKVTLPSGETRHVGYHLVLYNRGPHRATNLCVKAKVYVRGEDSGWRDVELADVDPEEFPLEVLDTGGIYPIPWTLAGSGHDIRKERRVQIALEWDDAKTRGRQRRIVPLRRGNIGSISR